VAIQGIAVVVFEPEGSTYVKVQKFLFYRINRQKGEKETRERSSQPASESLKAVLRSSAPTKVIKTYLIHRNEKTSSKFPTY
jgi:hypothetical protein